MRRLVPRLCCLLALASVAHAQATWDFGAGTGAPLSLPANITGGTITATNGTLTINITSASTGYTGASGGNSASVGAVAGAINTANSSYFSFALTPTSGNRLFASGLSVGSRSTASGPTALALYSSADNYTTPLATASVSASSNWALVTFPTFSVFGATNGSLTFRLYGSGGTSATAGNWRIDDLSFSVLSGPPGPAIATQPVSQNVPPGTTVSLSVVAAGSGTVSYQWRKGGTALNNTVYPSATTATLNLGVVATTDSGSYDVVVTDSIASTTSSVAVLTVAVTPATVTIDPTSLSPTFDGNPHGVVVTTNPASLSLSVTYNGQANSPPINAGTYAVVATITNPAFTGSATANLTIVPEPQTITFTTAAGYVPQVGVPFTVSASATGGSTVRFAIASGNATATGTNGATITIADTAPVAIRATQAGDANNQAATTAPVPPLVPATDLIVSAVNPAALATTYVQNFDGLATAMPAGWHVFTGASATALGTDVAAISSFVRAADPWSDTTGNFRNVASALNGGVTSADLTPTQAGYGNRALGVRQNGSFGDPGAAFGFNFATTGVSVSAVSFSAQILSVQADATIWLLQWAIGPSPTAWTTIATFNDPGAFGATTVSATSSTFGAALSNQGNVWLRVVALTATTFGGTRDTFAIDNFTISVGPVVSITTPPASLTRTSGQSATFSVSATGTGALSYQWRKGGSAIGGATGSTFTIPSVLTTDAGSYDVVVSDSVGSTPSAAATLTVNPIATTIAFTNLTATYDGNPHAATATPTLAGATVGSLTYTGIGSTGYAASTTAPTNPGTYLVTATVTDSEHQGTTSGILAISGAPGATAPSVTTAPVAQSVSVGDVVTFSIAVTGSPSPTLQWRKDGVAIPGAIGSTFTIFGAALTDAGNYDVAIANSGGSLLSPAAALTVAKKDQVITFVAPTTSFAAGTAVQLAATANSGLPVSYTIVSGAGSIIGNTLTGLGASVVVRASQPGNATAFNAAAVNVDQTFTFVAGGSAPFLFSSPSDQTVNAGATVTFAAAAIGTPTPTWQWLKNGVTIAGATSATLTLGGVTVADAASYTVTATNSTGTASASAALTVRAAPVFTASPTDQSVAGGVNVTFAASVTGSPTPALQWRKNGVAISGAVSNTLTLLNVGAADGARYDVVATSSLGTATSTAATLTVATRNFSGVYFGKFGSATPGVAVTGDFALYVRADGTAVLLGYLPGSGTGLASTGVTVDHAGNFSLSLTPTLATSSSTAASDFNAPSSVLSPLSSAAVPPTAAAAQTITLRGSLDDTTGAVTASVPELALTLGGTRVASTGPATAQAGFYSGALVGTADGRSYVIVGADGEAYVYASTSATVGGLKASVGANGRITVASGSTTTLPLGFTALDLGFNNGAITGTVTTTGGTATLTGASDALAGTQRLANISARGGVAPGAPLIAGFVITGSASKQVLIRAAGPALAAAPFNLAGTLDNPALAVFRGSAVIAQNDNWSAPAASATALTAAAASVNAFAFRPGSADAALLTTLAPGAYTVEVTGGAASSNGAGVALVEIYEILATGESPGALRLANLSARGPVAPGAPLIAGFVINGTAPQRVLVRGIGPALAGFGVPGALANPVLTLFSGATTLNANDDWFRDPSAALIRSAAAQTGAFALGATSLDASLLLYLAPGAYTAQVSGTGATPAASGIALVEIYEVP